MKRNLVDLIDYDKIYSSNTYGDFKILKNLGSKGTDHTRVEIQFIETGTIAEVDLAAAINGTVKDKYRPMIYGVGYFGNAQSKHRAHSIWAGMIRRCYDINHKGYSQYGAKGVTVCDRWKCFEYFLEDLPFIDGYDNWLQNPEMYQLDKDTLQQGIPYEQKIYSPSTCCFIRKDINMRNIENRGIFSKYRGVSAGKAGHYRADITLNNIKHCLGSFDSEIAAANAYNNAAIYYLGDNAVLNNVPYMNPTEVGNLRTAQKPMCKIINSD